MDLTRRLFGTVTDIGLSQVSTSRSNEIDGCDAIHKM